MRRSLLVTGVVSAGLVVVCVVLAVPAVVGAARRAGAARDAIARAEASARAGDEEAASRQLDAASRDARRAAGLLGSISVAPSARIPVLGRTVRAAREMSLAVAEAADAGVAALRVLPDGGLWSAGRVDLAGVRAVAGRAAGPVRTIEGALRRVERAPRSWLLPHVSGPRRELVSRLRGVRGQLRDAIALGDLLPAVLGEHGTRRYLLAVQNPAELRATGGFWGNFGIIEADGGRLRLPVFGRTTEDLGPLLQAPVEAPAWYLARYARFGAPADWRGLNMCPDFPTVATLAERNMDAIGVHGRVDGVLAVDPPGLAELLRLTGPVRVDGWPDPIEAGNVVEVTLREAYRRFERTDRAAFLGTVAHAVWTKLLGSDITLDTQALARFGDAFAEQRFLFHLRDAREQAVIERLGVAGGLRTQRPMFGLVTQNAAGNKMDTWLERSLSLDVRLRPDGSADVRATITLRNTGPAQGEPHELIGPYDDRFEAGVDRQYVSLYLPAGSRVVGWEAPDGLRGELEHELGLVVASRFVDVVAGGQVTVRYRVDVPDLWDPDGRRLSFSVRRQPALHPDDVHVRVRPPRWWRGGGDLGGRQLRRTTGFELLVRPLLSLP